MRKYYLGIDLGGSKILAGLFDEELNLVGRNKMRTKPERGFASVVERIARCASDLVDDFDIEKKSIVSLGIGTPGSIDAKGNVIFAGNLDWENVPLKKHL
ncbi:MAG: ROK family protein [Verrucomicrobia bacterium]|nr:ROK family protein [Verrucomicrobiota bacterium]